MSGRPGGSASPPSTGRCSTRVGIRLRPGQPPEWWEEGIEVLIGEIAALARLLADGRYRSVRLHAPDPRIRDLLASLCRRPGVAVDLSAA